jgi:hypothetical protein
VAILGAFVPEREVQQHAVTHRTAAGVGPFPADTQLRTGMSDESFAGKIPLMRAAFEEVCRNKGVLTYSEVMQRFALPFFPMTTALGKLGHACQDAGEPIITAIVVDKETRRCSDGILREFNVVDDAGERDRCYAKWSNEQPEVEPAPAPPSFVERFAKVKVRLQQSAFRIAVYEACGGRCVISGCDVPEALEAAHLLGRSWEAGQNSAADGILLRRDLHALYDRGVLVLHGDGRIEFTTDEARAHYPEWHGHVAVHLQAKGEEV